MASLNKVMLIGHLGRDPELAYTPGGLAVTKFTVATTDTRTDRTSGERIDKTEWHRIVTFGKVAENCARFLAKGSQVYLEGRLQTSSYEKDGITRYATDIVATTVTFLTKRSPEGGGQGRGFDPTQGGGHPGGYPNSAAHGGYGDDTPPDDDIPF